MNKTLIAIAVFVALILGGVTFISIKGEALIHQAAEKHGSKFLGATVGLDGVDLSPFSGQAALSGLSIGQPADFGDSNSFAVDGFAIELAPMSLLSDHIEISTILIDKPVMNLVLHGKDSNFGALMANLPAPADDEDEAGKKVSIQDLYLNGMTLMIESDQLGSHKATLADIHIQNIGVDKNGVAPEEALRITMDALKPQIAKVLVKLGIQSNLEDKLGVKLPTTKDDVKDALTGLFKKKKKN